MTKKSETTRQMVVRVVAEAAYTARKNGAATHVSSDRNRGCPNFSGRPMASYQIIDFTQEISTENKGSALGLRINEVLDHVKAKGTFARFARDVNNAARRIEWLRDCQPRPRTTETSDDEKI